MSKAFIIHRAKQGDPQAIASLLNESLAFRKVQIIDSGLTEGCLHLKLESHRIPNQKKLMPFIREEVVSLELPSVEKLEVVGCVTGNEEPVWKETVNLQNIASSFKEVAQIAVARSDEIEAEEISLELKAKRGDQGAILELINQAIEATNTDAKLRFNKGYLQILLEAESLADKEQLTQLIIQKITDVKLPLIKRISIYGKQTEQEIPLWHQDFDNQQQKIENKLEKPEKPEKIENKSEEIPVNSAIIQETETQESIEKSKQSPLKNIIFLVTSFVVGIAVGVGGFYVYNSVQSPNNSTPLPQPSEGTSSSFNNKNTSILR